MQECYETVAVKIVREMIRAYYKDNDVEKVVAHLNPENFTWIGATENSFISGAENMRKFLTESLIQIKNYKLIHDDYKLQHSSKDSYLVIVNLELQSPEKNLRHNLHLIGTFYLQLINDRLQVSNYHINPVIKNIMLKIPLCSYVSEKINLLSEQLYYYDMFLKFIDNDAMATKIFLYNKDFQYKYVNQKYIELLNCKRVKDFIAENNNSLEHIYPADQKRYAEYLKNRFDAKLKSVAPSGEWQWQDSYCITYRLCSSDEYFIELGNLFTSNATPIVTATIFPIEDMSVFNSFKATQNVWEGIFRADELLNDFGIRIGKDIILYQKNRQISIDGKLIDLTPTEFGLLLGLIDNLNKTISAEDLYADIWNDEELIFTSNTLKMHISNIRRKLKLYGSGKIQLDTIKGVGYRLWINEN